MTLPCVADDFDRVDDPTSLGTATTGEVWTLQSTGTYDASGNPIAAVGSILGTSSNRAYSSDTRITGAHGEPGYLNIGTIDTGFADFDVGLGVVLGFAEGAGGGMAFRWSSATAHWIAIVYRQIGTGDYFVILRKQTGGGATFSSPIVTLVAATGATGAHPLRVRGRGPYIETWYDGAPVATIKDPFNAAETRHGLASYFSTTVRFDDLSMCEAPRPPYVGGLQAS